MYEAHLFENDAFNLNGERLEELVFSERRYNEYRQRLSTVRIREITSVGGHLLDMNVINRRIGVRVTWVEWFRLRTELTRIKTRYAVDDNTEPRTLNDFVERSKKGSRKYRDVMIGRISRWYKQRVPSKISSVITLWGEYRNQMGRTLIEINLGLWSLSFLDADFKNFLFKFVHGRLYLNQARAHFADVPRYCTLCGIVEKRRLQQEGIFEYEQAWQDRLQALQPENVKHLFWECVHVREVIRAFIGELAEENVRRIDRNKFMGGYGRESVMQMKLMLLTVHTVKYYIYKCKNRFKLPTLPGIRYEYANIYSQVSTRERWAGAVEDLVNIMKGVHEVLE